MGEEKNMTLSTGTYLAMALMVGLLAAFYLPMNAAVGRHLGSPLTATITFYTVALISTIVAFLFVGDTSTLKNLGTVPKWLFLTGVASACVVFAITFLIPKIGARQMSLLGIAGQITMAMIVSHFGLLGTPEDPVTLKKIIGAGLIFFGVVTTVT